MDTDFQTSKAMTAMTPALRIKIIGLGGGGSNVVAGLSQEAYPQVKYTAINSDAQALNSLQLENKVLVGSSVTRGLGAGGDPEIGARAVDADRATLAGLVEDTDLIILVVGLGGGTGTMAALLLAELALETDAIVIAFATIPFTFEGGRRREIAQTGLDKLRNTVHGLIPVPNDFLLQEADEAATALTAFAVADQWIGRGIHSINTMLFETGVINQDFGALRNLFQGRGGKTIFATGSAHGDDFVAKALDNLLANPLLHISERPKHLDRILVNLIAGSDLGLAKMQAVVLEIGKRFESSQEIIFGAVIDPNRTESLEICLLAKAELDGANPSKKVTIKSRQREALEMDDGLGLDAPISVEPKKQMVHKSKLRKKKVNAVDQDEFLFVDLDAQRGYFDQTKQNLYNGEDLDVPTYLRRGIKIKLKF
jgi:cell division protein FtsZ